MVQEVKVCIVHYACGGVQGAGGGVQGADGGGVQGAGGGVQGAGGGAHGAVGGGVHGAGGGDAGCRVTHPMDELCEVVEVVDQAYGAAAPLHSTLDGCCSDKSGSL